MAGERPQPNINIAEQLGDELVWIDARDPALSAPVTGWAMSIERPAKMSADENNLQGDLAYALAEDIVRTDGGMTPAAVAAYKEAGRSFINVVAASPIDEKMNFVLPPNDWIRHVKIGTIYGKLARAKDELLVGFYESEEVDTRSHLRQISKEALQKAGVSVMGEDHVAVTLAGEVTSVDPVKLFASAAVQATQEVRGPEVVHKDAVEELVEGGSEQVVGFLEKQATLRKAGGKEFDPAGVQVLARTGEIILERTTESHILPALALSK